MVEEGLPQTAQETSTGPGMEPETTATTILASVKEQIISLSAQQQLSPGAQLAEQYPQLQQWLELPECCNKASKEDVSEAVRESLQCHSSLLPLAPELQFQRLTRELEVERQIVANQLERCRLGAESPSIASTSSTEKSFPWRSSGIIFYPSANTATNRVMRRVSSVPSRAQSPSYVVGTGVSPSRGSLRTSLGGGYGSPGVAEQRSLPSHAYSSSTLPVQRAGSPYAPHRPASPSAVRRVGSLTSRQPNPGSGAAQYQAAGRVGSPLALTDVPTRVGSPSQTQLGSSSPKRSGMTAVPQHLGTTLQRTIHDMEQYGQQYDIYERMVPPRPDSLTGLRSSYASQHSQLGQELRSAVSPDMHITPIYEGRTFYSPVYRSPNHGTVELHHGSQAALFRTGSGMGNLQRSSSQRSTLTYQRNTYGLPTAAALAEPLRAVPFRLPEPAYGRLHPTPDGGTTRSPSIDSIHKDPRQVPPGQGLPCTTGHDTAR
ncbi:hypothetical protein DUI87_31022 [Hirundo rustica rustica]|uniref:Plakophilin 4 n=1 Tax=Hirundo rustica rustica TaxID=333673 RepID=A0A3M0IVT0_HIRRU|nr:hypothetical protein DUI87_31022 [Hirundo rustica rustica]